MPRASRPEEGLARLFPALLAVWRSAKKGAGRGPRGPAHRGPPPPPDRLAADELREVAGGVKALSQGLTRARELVGERYMDDERLLGAYLLFYWPISYLQGRAVLGELARTPRTILDLGSGPGPLSFAALDAGAAEVTAADRSARALAAARRLAVEVGEALGTREWDPLANRPPLGQLSGPVDAVTMGHVLNELWTGDDAVEKRAALCEEALKLVRPGGSLVVIEPALRDTSRALLAVRDRLVARGHAVRAPCLFRGPCPALLRESDWCHAEREIATPPVVAELARLAGLHKEAVKMSYFAVAPAGEAWPAVPEGRLFRIVSEPLPGKGRLRYMGCGPEGRIGLALQEKHVVKENRAFEFLKRGDVVRVEGGEPKGDGLGLDASSSVKVVAAAGKPVLGPDGF